MAAPPPLARRCSPRFSRQEVREPDVELRHALLRYGNRDLLVGHPLELGGLARGLGRPLVGLALLGPLVPIGAAATASVGLAAILATPSAPAATGQEPGEERVE